MNKANLTEGIIWISKRFEVKITKKVHPKKKLNKEHEHRYAASATCVRTILFKVAKAQGMRF